MPAGRPPVPTERKRARGNPGKRALPDKNQTVALEMAEEIPTPPRPLAAHGQEFWNRIWEAARQWVSPTTDIELALLVSEQIDERVALRYQVITNNDPGDRRALRDLEKQIVSNLSLLGFTPTDRSRLGLAEVKAATKLEQLRAARNG